LSFWSNITCLESRFTSRASFQLTFNQDLSSPPSVKIWPTVWDVSS
jgi:hypothetical protein